MSQLGAEKTKCPILDLEVSRWWAEHAKEWIIVQEGNLEAIQVGITVQGVAQGLLEQELIMLDAKKAKTHGMGATGQIT